MKWIIILAKKKVTQDTWSQIRGKYVAGSDPIYKIAQQHEINKKTIERRAKKENWIYGSKKINVSEAIESATIETLIQNGTDKSVILTETFLRDAANIRGVTMAIMGAMAKELKKCGGNIATAEANRLVTCQKVSEVASKTISNLYTSTRKALGMDREEELKKTLIKVDITDGLTHEEVKAKIKELSECGDADY